MACRPDDFQSGELACALGVDPDTIRRNPALLESRGTGLIKQGRRYLLDHRRAIHTLCLTTDQAQALYLAARLLTRHSDEHNPHAASALDQLADAMAVRPPELARHIHVAAQSIRTRSGQPHVGEILDRRAEERLLVHAEIEARRLALIETDRSR